MKNVPLNEAQSEARLRFAFECSTVRWIAPKDDEFASITPESGKHLIYLPPNYDDDYTLRTLFHELAHVAFPGELGAWGSFDEDILMRVIEPRMMDYIIKHPRKHEWWLSKLAAIRERPTRKARK